MGLGWVLAGLGFGVDACGFAGLGLGLGFDPGALAPGVFGLGPEACGFGGVGFGLVGFGADGFFCVDGAVQNGHFNGS